MRALGANSACIIAPALARPVWAAEAIKWEFPHVVHSIKYGPERKNLSVKQMSQRAEAYAAPFRVISYDLLGKMPPGQFDFIIADECHEICNPLAAQSRQFKTLCKLNPNARILLLSATPARNDPRELWNLIDCLQSGWAGRPSKTGDAPWPFLNKWCISIPNDYAPSGKVFGGINPHKADAFRELVGAHIYRITESQFAEFLPPLNAEPLYIDTKRTPLDIVSDILYQQTPIVPHISLHCVHHELALKFHSYALASYPKHHVEYIDGTIGVEERAKRIEACKNSERSILIATSGSVEQSISLSYVKFAAIFEWGKSIAKLAQLMGRFPRLDAESMVPTTVRYVVMPGEEAKVSKVFEAVTKFNAVLGADLKTSTLGDVFTARIFSQDEVIARMESIFGDARLSLMEDDDDE
jgi:hypothetical protein